MHPAYDCFWAKCLGKRLTGLVTHTHHSKHFMHLISITQSVTFTSPPFRCPYLLNACPQHFAYAPCLPCYTKRTCIDFLNVLTLQHTPDRKLSFSIHSLWDTIGTKQFVIWSTFQTTSLHVAWLAKNELNTYQEDIYLVIYAVFTAAIVNKWYEYVVRWGSQTNLIWWRTRALVVTDKDCVHLSV
jgi:hypothetical protein